jgi:hypothetical protein
MDQSTVISIIVGGLISLLASLGVTYFYYRRATADLNTAADKLRALRELTLYALLNPGAKLEARRDEHGRIIGLIVSMVGTAAGRQ